MALIAATILLGAVLFFHLQLVLGKALLPWFGGTPSVWTACLFFFQALLLAGYAWAHGLARLSPRSQRRWHLTLLAASLAAVVALTLRWGSPLTPGPAWKPPDSREPVLKILTLLAVAVGLPGLALASTAPLVQVWARRANPGRSPYRLYALSNLGSFLALAAFALVLEPRVPLRAQAAAWCVAFALFAASCGALAERAGRAGPEMPAAAGRPAGTLERAPRLFLWFALAAAPSTVLSAATNQMGQAVASVPFLWALTLGVYLLSFVLCFGRVLIGRGAAAAALAAALVLVCAALYRYQAVPVAWQISIHTFAVFACATACHRELARAKPPSERLTAYYLTLAAGGAAGGLFVAAVAPRVFRGIWEYPAGLCACAFLFCLASLADPGSFLRRHPLSAAAALLLLAAAFPLAAARASWPHGPSLEAGSAVFLGALLAGLVAAVFAFSIAARPRGWRSAAAPAVAVASLAAVLLQTALGFDSRAVHVARNFFGVLRVVALDGPASEDRRLRLFLGRNPQGEQSLTPARSRETFGAYAPEGGAAVCLRHHRRRPAPLSIGVVGLGVGAIAALAQPGDRIRFYEINPEVTRLSAGPDAIFSYVRESAASVDVAEGDGRILIERELAAGGTGRFDVLVCDVSAGGWIPPHLLTKEAFAAYVGLLGPDGLLAVHVDTQYFDLRSVVRRQAEELGLAAVQLAPAHGTWLVVPRRSEFLSVPAIAAVRGPDLPRAGHLWTDDFSSPFDALR